MFTSEFYFVNNNLVCPILQGSDCISLLQEPSGYIGAVLYTCLWYFRGDVFYYTHCAPLERRHQEYWHSIDISLRWSDMSIGRIRGPRD